MNSSFKVVFNKVRGALMVVNEVTSSVQAKGTKTVVAAVAAVVLGAGASAAMAEGATGTPATETETTAQEGAWLDAPTDPATGLVISNAPIAATELGTNKQFSFVFNAEGKQALFGASTATPITIAQDQIVWSNGDGDKHRASGIWANTGNAVDTEVVTNNGTMYATGFTSYQNRAIGVTSGTAINAGVIVAKNAYGMTAGSGGGTDAVAAKIINNGKIFVHQEGVGIELGGAGTKAEAVNNGTITVDAVEGDHFLHGVLIKGEGATAAEQLAGQVFTNAANGKIIAGAGSQAIMVQNAKDSTITNNGTITGDIDIQASNTNITLVNTKTITGNVKVDGVGSAVTLSADSKIDGKLAVTQGTVTAQGAEVKDFETGADVDVMVTGTNKVTGTLTNAGDITLATADAALELQNATNTGKILGLGKVSVKGNVTNNGQLTLAANPTTPAGEIEVASGATLSNEGAGVLAALKATIAGTVKSSISGGKYLVQETILNEGGVWNIAALNSNSQDQADGAKDRLLIAGTPAAAATITLNGGQIRIGDTTEAFKGNLKLGGADGGSFGATILNISAGTYENSAVELTNSGSQINVKGGTYTVGALTLTRGNVTVEEGGQLNLTTVTANEGHLTLAGGTLQTTVGQVYKDGATTAADATPADATLASTSVVKKDFLTLTSGKLLLTDEGEYTADFFNSLKSTFANGTITLVNATLKTGGTTKIDLTEGQETLNNDAQTSGEAGAPEEPAKDGEVFVPVTVTVPSTSGAASLQVKLPEPQQEGADQEIASKVTLAATAPSTLTLAGDTAGKALVTNEKDDAIAVTVGNNVTVNIGKPTVEGGEAPAATAGSLPALTVAEGGKVNVVNSTLTTDAVTVSGGEVNVGAVGAASKLETKTLEVSSGSLSVVNAAVTAETVKVSSNVNIGSSDARGEVVADTLELSDGAVVFLDPEWTDDSLIEGASSLATSTLKVDGNAIVAVAQNSILTVGSKDKTEAVNAFKKLGLEWGDDKVEALAFLMNPLTDEAPKLLVDGSLTDEDRAGVTAAGQTSLVKIGATSLLIIDQAKASETEPYVKGEVENEGKIGVVNAKTGKIKVSTVALTNQEGEVVTDNPFVSAKIDGEYIDAELETDKFSEAVSSMGMQAMLRRADFVFSQSIADRTAFNQDLGKGLNLWANVQGEKYKTDGYDAGGNFSANMGYGQFGADIAVNDKITAGAALQYGKGKLDSDSYGIENDLNNYGFALYGTFAATDAVKLVGEVSYLWGKNDLTASEDFLNQKVDTNMLSAGVTAQTTYSVGQFDLIPSIGLRVSRLHTDSMTFGAMSIDSQNQTLWQLPIALRVSGKLQQTAGWQFAPTAKIAFVPTFGDKEYKALGVDTTVIDTAPVQGDFGVLARKGNLLLDAVFQVGGGKEGTSSVGGKVGVKYLF